MTFPIEEIETKLVFAVLTYGAGWAAKKIKEEWKFRLPSLAFRRGIHGTWSGQVSQSVGGDFIPFPIRLHLRATWRATVGHGDLTTKSATGSFQIKGGLFSDQFLKLEYWSSDRTKLQFGTMILRLAATGDKLEGQFVGFWPSSNSFVDGKIALEKVQS